MVFLEPKDGISIPPNQIGCNFVPLLAFDQSGNRIGYGKGFYDRFFEDCTQKPLKLDCRFSKLNPIIYPITLVTFLWIIVSHRRNYMCFKLTFLLNINNKNIPNTYRNICNIKNRVKKRKIAPPIIGTLS